MFKESDEQPRMRLLMNGIAEILARQQVHSVFQPIVDLDTDAVVAYEALARGPAGDLQRPDRLFAAAAAAGRLSDLDGLCQRSAIRGAIDTGIFSPLTLFINIEPEVVDADQLDDLLRIAHDCPKDLQLMLEITERALAVRPADLLATVRRLRAAGWRIALDDVGADDLSLALMPLLQPDVIKLDMALVQGRPGRKVAEIMNAVNAYADRTGSAILAEGIETPQHLATARALGATLGQGWWFGRPAEGPVSGRPASALRLPPMPSVSADLSPFRALPKSVTLRHSTKSLLIEVSKHLEREAKRLGRTCVVLSTFQHARHFTPLTARRYQDLAKHVGFVAAIGAQLNVEPVTGVRGANLEPADPIGDEWDIAVLAPHFAAALIARDVGSQGADIEREFEFALTYDRNVVEAAARSLMSRVLPEPVDGRPSAAMVITGTVIGGGYMPDITPQQSIFSGDDIDIDVDGDLAVAPSDRRHLLMQAETPLLEASMNNTGAAVVYLHLDGLRVGNEHHTDAILEAAVNRLQRRIRRRDLIAIHDHDIIIILPDLHREDTLRQAQQIVDALAAELSTLSPRRRDGALTVTIGMSTFPADGNEAATLIDTARVRCRASIAGPRCVGIP